ncbi:MAG: TonB family protein [Calditrichaeota bacterium]|nr:MAG: TonB family protein [Calditrichota bacterium]
MRRILGFFSYLVVALPLIAQTNFHGTLTENTTWQGVINLDGDVIVPKGITLTIEPGSRILCTPNKDKTGSGMDPEKVEIIVLGVLQANGKSGEGQIVFTSGRENPQMNDWYGIIFKKKKNTSSLNHSIVEYAYKGITCYGSSPQIDGCEIRFNYYIGVSCEIRSRPIIRNSIILGNGFAGITSELASEPIVENTVITQNANGVIVFDRSRVDLGSINGDELHSTGENRIFNNFEIDIYNRTTNELYAQNNIWNVNSPSEIHAKIYDTQDNPTVGAVIIEPVYTQISQPIAQRNRRTPPLSTPPPTTPEVSPAQSNLAEQQSNQEEQQPQTSSRSIAEATQATNGKPNPTPVSSNSTRTQNPVPQPPVSRNQTTPNTTTTAQRTPPALTQTSQTETANTNSSTENTSASTPQPIAQSTSPPITQPTPPPSKRVTPAQPQHTEPIIEALLDSGRRHYVRRAIPKYPEIYQRTHYQGKVLMEVIVDTEGNVESYKVLSSDGEFFTQAAEEAIQKMKYKPETFQGKPVRFKIVEPFIFKLK